MNRKKWVRAGLGLLIAGAILFGVGYAMGGFDGLMRTVDQKSQSYQADEVDAIRIESTSADVRVERTAGDAVEVIYFEGEREGVKPALESGVLVLRQYDERSWRDHIGFHIGGGRDIVVRVPGSLADAEIISTSGDIELIDVDVAGALSVGSTSGVIQVGGSAGTVELSTTSGGIEATDLAAAGDAEAGSTSGRIVLSRVTAAGALTASTTSGDIRLTEAKAEQFDLGSTSGDIRLSGAWAANGAGTLSAATTSGEIRVSDVSAAAYVFGSVSGDVRGSLPGSVRDYAITSQTVSGGNSLPTKSDGGGKTIHATTTSGDIKLAFEDE